MRKFLYSQLAAVACAMIVSVPALAAETLLGETELQLAQGSATVQLWGGRLPNGYADDLLLMVNAADGTLITACKPSIKGGYNPLLAAVQVQPKSAEAGEQLLVSLGQGDWSAPREFRILDFAKPKQVEEIFSSADSMGIVSKAHIKEDNLLVTLVDGKENTVPMREGVELQGRVEYGGLHALTVHDVDGDGQQELFSCQQLGNRSKQWADVGAVWRLAGVDTATDKQTQEEQLKQKKWLHGSLTIMTAPPADKNNTINDGYEFAAGTILPYKMVLPGGEATYPVFASQNLELQKKINELLAEENTDYLQMFYAGAADMAFKVITADARVLSLQLISGKSDFVHHHVNIDPATGEKLALKDVLHVDDKDLLALLKVLCTNKTMSWDSLPREWYIEGKNLFLMERVDGKDEVAGFALGNLHKFLKDKKWLGN